MPVNEEEIPQMMLAALNKISNCIEGMYLRLGDMIELEKEKQAREQDVHYIASRQVAMMNAMADVCELWDKHHPLQPLRAGVKRNTIQTPGN